MARPIKPTPILKGKASVKFAKSVEENLKKPVKMPSIPCLKAAKAAVFANA